MKLPKLSPLCKALAYLCLLSCLNITSPQLMAATTTAAEGIAQFPTSSSYTKLQHRKLEIERLEENIKQQTKNKTSLLTRRLIKLQIRLMEKEIDYAQAYLLKDESEKNAIELSAVKAILNSHSKLVKHIHHELTFDLKLPEPNMDIAEEMSVYNQIFSMKGNSDHVYALYIQSITLAKELALDVSHDEQQLRDLLDEIAANNAVILEYNIDNSINFRTSLKALPGDTDLKGRLNLTEQRTQLLASSLQTTIDLMTKLNMDTSSYQELVIMATGQLTTEVFNSGVVNRLVDEWSNKLTLVLINDSPDILLKTCLFIIIILVAIKFSRFSEGLLSAAMKRPGLHLSHLLRRMLASVTSKAILLLGILIALSQIGISLAPLLAGLGVAGFIIGFAMQDTLSNFASGMMILIYRPFDEGDMIEAGGVYGCVNKMNLVSTTILTLDNQTIMVPNNKIWGDVIKNFTHQEVRRVDLLFGISYTDNIIHAEEIIWSILNADERILESPLPLVKVHELGESSVNIIVRPWAKTADYWDLYWDLIRTVKLRFDEEGISIPFPQRDLHLKTQQAIHVKIEKDT